jgi:hypothetical protein
VQIQRLGDQAGGVEVRHRPLIVVDEILGRVGVAGTEQDDGLPGLFPLAEDVEDEGRAEFVAVPSDAVTTIARRRVRHGGQQADGTDAAYHGQRRRDGEDLLLDRDVLLPLSTGQSYPARGCRT